MKGNREKAIEELREAQRVILDGGVPRVTVAKALALLAEEPEERCGFEGCTCLTIRGRSCRDAGCHGKPRPAEPPERHCVRCGVLLGSVYIVECLEPLCADCAYSPEPTGGREFVLRRFEGSERFFVDFTRPEWARLHPEVWASEVLIVREVERLHVEPAKPATAEWRPVR